MVVLERGLGWNGIFVYSSSPWKERKGAIACIFPLAHSLSLNENPGVGLRMILQHNAGEEMNWTVLHYYIMCTSLSPLVFIFLEDVLCICVCG